MQASFELLVARHQNRVYTLCLRMTGNPEDGDDLTQEIFTKVFFSLPRFEGRSAFSSWLYRIAYNHCLNHIRKRKQVQEALSEYSRHELLARRELGPSPLSQLQLALDHMTPEPRSLLIFKYVLGMDLEEIAETLDISVGAVKMRLLRARDEFKRNFQEDSL